MSNEMVSALVPCYNHELFVAQTLRSLIAQTYINMELVVIDDGSSDRSAEVIESLRPDLERRFKRFLFIRKQNQGVSATLNLGISLSASPYVYILSSDDIAAPTAVAKHVAAIEAAHTPVALCCNEAEFIDVDGTPVFLDECGNCWPTHEPGRFGNFIPFYTRGRPDWDLHRNFGTYESLLTGNYIPPGLTVVREVLLDIRFDENLALEDWDMWLRLSKDYRLLYVPEVLTRYRWHSKNSIKTMKKRLILESRGLLARERKYCFKNGLKSQWQDLALPRFKPTFDERPILALVSFLPFLPKLPLLKSLFRKAIKAVRKYPLQKRS